MAHNEFDLIQHYFTKPNTRSDVITGNGDDCAILRAPEGYDIAMSVDTLVSGLHFDHTFSPEDIGYKSLAVNLSDLAASGAEPAWVMLALTLPHIDEDWLSGFQKGFFEHFATYPMTLIGGDLTKGPMSISIQVSGLLPRSSQLLRSGAKIGDRIYVTHELGDAVLALHYLHKKKPLSEKSAEKILPRLYRPTPRITTGIALRHIATAAIDISDGLYGDLNHILKASRVGAIINVDAIPVSDVLANEDTDFRRMAALHSGDAYELCFTVPKNTVLPALPCNFTCIGEIIEECRVVLLGNNNQPITVTGESFKHF